MKHERTYCTAMRICGSTLLVFGCGYPLGASAEEVQHYRFNIPPQNLAPALNTYSIQADQQIVYSKEMVTGRKSPGVYGEYGAEEALTKVLGTNEIVFSRTGSNVLVLAQAEPAHQASAPRSQATATDASVPTQERFALEEIVVTAQKVEENLQRTPVSVATLLAEDLAQRSIVDPSSLQGVLPGVQFQPIGDVLVTIRGLGTFNLQPGVDAAVAYNVDGVYLAHGTALPPLLFDLERIEALRGPQGTLFGRNANAGAINTVTRKPEHEFQANAAVGAGNYDLLTTEAMLNVPLGERVALRAAFATQDRDGYIRDGHNDAKIRAGRVRLLVEPTETVRALFTVDYAKEDDVGAGGSTPCPLNYAIQGCNNSAWDAFDGNETPTPGDYRRVENVGVYGEVNWTLPSASLTSITSWRRVEFANLTTTGNANIPFAEFGYNPSNTDHLFTQELRLNSLAEATTKWAVGAYYSRERLDNRIGKAFGGFVGIVEDLPHYRSTSKALFAQATTPVADGLRVTAGARYTKEDIY